MKYFFLYFIVRMFLNNPLAAILLVLIIYAVVDRQFIGILPDFLTPWRRARRISALKRDIAINPYDGRAFYELGATLVEKGRVKESRSYLEKAQNLMPNHPDVQFYLGWAYLRSGLPEEGKIALERALDLNPKVKYGEPYVYLLEYTLLWAKNQEKIDEYLKKIAEYGSPQFYYELGMLFQKAGQRDKAREMFREALVSYRNSPHFYKKQYRYWAFRAKLRSF